MPVDDGFARVDGGFACAKSFRTRDLAELSNATPPITTSFVPVVGVAKVEGAEADAEVDVVLLKLNVDEDGTVVVLAELEEVAGVVVDAAVVS